MRPLEAIYRLHLTLAQVKQLPFSVDKLQTIFNQLERENYPVIHHSSVYKQSYQPAYRVVLSTLLPGLIDDPIS
jgi:hypothetical protein